MFKSLSTSLIVRGILAGPAAHRCFRQPAMVLPPGQAAAFSLSVTAERMAWPVRRSSMPCTSAEAP